MYQNSSEDESPVKDETLSLDLFDSGRSDSESDQSGEEE